VLTILLLLPTCIVWIATDTSVASVSSHLLMLSKAFTNFLPVMFYCYFILTVSYNCIFITTFLPIFRRVTPHLARPVSSAQEKGGFEDVLRTEHAQIHLGQGAGALGGAGAGPEAALWLQPGGDPRVPQQAGLLRLGQRAQAPRHCSQGSKTSCCKNINT
jgi:hypothetical protein